MAEQLKVLGAQRIKALQSILKTRKGKVIEAYRATQLTHTQIKRKADDEFGVTSLRNELKQLEAQLQTVQRQIQGITGESFDRYSSSRQNTAWSKRIQELTNEQEKGVKEIEARFAEKNDRLWLCSTLEEAKALVESE